MRVLLLLCSLIAVVHMPAAPARADQPAPPPPAVTGGFFALSTGDGDRLVAWYRDNLGFTVDQSRTTPSGVKGALLSRPGALLEIGQLPSARSRAAAGIPDGIGAVHGIMKIGLLVSDLDGLYAIARERRLDISFAPTQPAGNPLRTFAVKDPDGNTVQFFGK
jgi:catechol 2,3-dioxygenase-like lactoylglutathione lyase family enzyme